jgi:hypothetical protein
MHLHLLSAISTSIIELVGLEVVAMATKFMAGLQLRGVAGTTNYGRVEL